MHNATVVELHQAGQIELVEESLAKAVCKLSFPLTTSSELALSYFFGVGNARPLHPGAEEQNPMASFVSIDGACVLAKLKRAMLPEGK